ncbi:MAG: PilX N-terminal domain-containing pilus assembly protein [Moraxellaceae bacterium]|nr:PilX N-terminal domain-containing pilus assembly protein [Moraxellaceae bacterium]
MNRWRPGSRQQGVALFVCLMILLVLSVLGISAMRMSMSQSTIASSSLASGMAFQAAETAISRAIADAGADGELDLRAVLPDSLAAPNTRCLSAGDMATTACAAETYSDSKGVSKAAVVVSLVNPDDETAEVKQARLRYAVANVGVVGAQPITEAFVFTATGSIDALGIRTTNVQETMYPHL